MLCACQNTLYQSRACSSTHVEHQNTTGATTFCLAPCRFLHLGQACCERFSNASYSVYNQGFELRLKILGQQRFLKGVVGRISHQAAHESAVSAVCCVDGGFVRSPASACRTLLPLSPRTQLESFRGTLEAFPCLPRAQGG